MFASGATPGKVDTFMYNEEDEDFTKGWLPNSPLACNC
jgi:phosphatidylinositol glycan class N